MPLVGKVGRRRPRARLAMALLYLVLALGALTTLGPFALMASTGLKGPTDQNDNRLVPKYLADDAELLAKYVDDKYAGDASAIKARTDGGMEPGEYESYLVGLPPDRWKAAFALPPGGVTSRLVRRYQDWLRRRYGRDIDRLNRAYVEEALDFGTVMPPADLLERKAWSPPDTLKYREWRAFKATLPAEYRLPVTQRRLFQTWAAGKWKNRIEDVPEGVRQKASSFEDLRLPKDPTALRPFAQEALPARYAGLEDRDLPQVGYDYAFVESYTDEIRSEFATRNLRYVLDYVLLNGRAVWVTAAFCGLAVLAALVVNPLAAYALSRYPVRGTGAILVFLLATMAFPAEVAMIPSFLLLKRLGLLNTFAALVLPGAASGYMVFLLKGFFDSLPQELFEAASLDGARETTLMLRVALPLSRPVLGYQALIAFMGAYGAFLYAFLVAQDPKMWTLTVWLYQLQNGAPKAVMMAAVTVAAVPTLLVFLLAQRTILRGIVLPGER